MSLLLKDYLPKDDIEADRRLISRVRRVVLKEDVPVEQAGRMLKGALKNTEKFEEEIWPNFILSLSQKEILA